MRIEFGLFKPTALVASLMLSCLAIPPNMEEFGEVCELVDETDCSDCDSVTDFFEKIINNLREGQEMGML